MGIIPRIRPLFTDTSTVGLITLLKACPHWRLLPKPATVAEFGDCRQNRRLLPTNCRWNRRLWYPVWTGHYTAHDWHSNYSNRWALQAYGRKIRVNSIIAKYIRRTVWAKRINWLRTRSSATAERQRISYMYTRLSRITHWSCTSVSTASVLLQL